MKAENIISSHLNLFTLLDLQYCQMWVYFLFVFPQSVMMADTGIKQTSFQTEAADLRGVSFYKHGINGYFSGCHIVLVNQLLLKLSR